METRSLLECPKYIQKPEAADLQIVGLYVNRLKHAN